MIVRCLIVTLLLLLSACKKYPLTVTEEVDLQRFMGKWYEIAAYPIHHQPPCSCTTSEFMGKPKHLVIRNSCYIKYGNKLKHHTETAKAVPIPKTLNSHLDVEFHWPLDADFWIVYVDPSYQYAAISVPNKQFLWILSRTPVMNPLAYERLVVKLAFLGFDISKLKETDQNCDL
jgi:apolipoprotein D and lipocalin family protein